MKKTKIKNPSPLTSQVPDRLYFRIRDVARLAGVKPYVLRYWEKEFPMISPEKSASGHRVYRRADVETVLLIRNLLHVERFSIEGARNRIKQLQRKEGNPSALLENSPPEEHLLEGSRENDRLSRIASEAKELKVLAATPISAFFSY